MKVGQIVGGFVLLVWSGLAIPSTAMAQSYDKELKDVATALVAKLEAANQRSGTVLDFTDLQGSETELGRFLAQELSDQLVSAGKSISFVDRANLQYLLRENKLSTEGLINPESSRKLGNLMGIDTLLFGTVTPMGERSVRLSVRAVAVETGKIVVAQSVTLPMSDNLASMYTHGVASNAASTGTSIASARTTDSRSQLRADSIKMAGTEVVIQNTSYCGGLPNDTCVSATTTLQNLSGIGFDAAITKGSTSLGGCIPEYGKFSGLSVIDETGRGEWRYIPSGGRLNITIVGFPCDPALSRTKSADVTTSVAVKIAGQTFSFPVSALAVPVRNRFAFKYPRLCDGHWAYSPSQCSDGQ